VHGYFESRSCDSRSATVRANVGSGSLPATAAAGGGAGIGVSFRFATTDSLRSAATVGFRALHFSGHATRAGALAFEDGTGGVHLVRAPQLRDLFAAGTHTRMHMRTRSRRAPPDAYLDAQGRRRPDEMQEDEEKESARADGGGGGGVPLLVFVSACCSELAGQAFVQVHIHRSKC
jgi:hypothetical protein